MDAVWPYVWSIGPTVAVGLLFWFVMRSILHADRNERTAMAKYEAEADLRLLEAARAEEVERAAQSGPADSGRQG